MKRVLFVDDDPNIVQGLRRMLRSLRDEWQVELATSGHSALMAIEREPFDIVVSDMKMPGMDGAELLTRVKDLHPESIRIILSGHSERNAVLKSLGPAHQYLSKPCAAEVLKATIERAYALRRLMNCTTFKKLVSQIQALPSLPSLYQDLVNELRKKTPTLGALARIIAQDIGMSANTLKLVNSAYFGSFEAVTSVERAVTCLGLETINDLLRIGIFFEYSGPEVSGFSLEALCRHSTFTAAYARTIAGLEEPDGGLATRASQAGMLHDVGNLILAGSMSERYGRVLQRASERKAPISEIEKEELGATHSQIGAYLIGLWGLPEPIMEAIAYHERPAECPHPGRGLVAIVHVANVLAHESGGLETAGAPPRIDLEYLKASGLLDRVQVWRDACVQPIA